MRAKKKTIKKQGKLLLQSSTEKCSIAVYGGCKREDNEGLFKCLTHNMMKKEFDDSVIECFPLKNGSVTAKIKDKGGVDVGGISKKNHLSTMSSRLFFTFSFKTVNERCCFGVRWFKE